MARNRSVPNCCAARIVVIGGSNSAARDIHATPVGRMPGSMILINAIHTVRQHGALRAPSGVLSYGLVAAQVLLLASLFYLLDYRKATVIALVLVSLLTFGLSTVLLKSGIWIDATMASCGVVLHRWIAIWNAACMDSEIGCVLGPVDSGPTFWRSR